MKIKEFIKTYCETCNVKINSSKEYKKHFNRNHTLRTIGQMVINTNLPNQGSKVKIGTALTNAKAGDTLLVKLE